MCKMDVITIFFKSIATLKTYFGALEKETGEQSKGRKEMMESLKQDSVSVLRVEDIKDKASGVEHQGTKCEEYHLRESTQQTES